MREVAGGVDGMGEKKSCWEMVRGDAGLPSSFEAPLCCAPQDEGSEVSGGNPLSCKI
jgi:hypothetical protein